MPRDVRWWHRIAVLIRKAKYSPLGNQPYRKAWPYTHMSIYVTKGIPEANVNPSMHKRSYLYGVSKLTTRVVPPARTKVPTNT